MQASGSGQTTKPKDVITANRFSITIDGHEIATFSELSGSSLRSAVRTGNMAAARRSCTLTMFSAEGKPVAKYWLEKAWPSKIDLAGLRAGASDALIETVVLTAEYVQRVDP